jgi:predicted cupin superfamily sugar epimerase
MLTAERLIALLALKPLPHEGGFYRETWRCAHSSGDRAAGTAIYYLLTPDTESALHRLPGDEVYHFYLGDPVELLLLEASGGRLITLGPDLLAGQVVQTVVPGGVWQGSVLRPGGAFALLGTTMSPGFDFSDYAAADGTALVQRYPAFAERIRRLTRS